VAVQTTVDAVFMLHTTSRTVYFEENYRVIIVKCTYLMHVNSMCVILQIPFLFKLRLEHVKCILIVSSRMLLTTRRQQH